MKKNKVAISIVIFFFLLREVYFFLSPKIIIQAPAQKIVSAYSVYDNFIDPEDYGAVWGYEVKSPEYSDPGGKIVFYYPLFRKSGGNNKLDIMWDVYPDNYENTSDLLLLDDKEYFEIKKKAISNYIFINKELLYFFEIYIYVDINSKKTKLLIKRYPWSNMTQLTTAST